MDYLLDTNAIIYAVKNRTDFEELIGKKPIVAEQILRELDKIQDTGAKSDREAAKIAIQIIKSKKFKIIDLGNGHTDNLLINYTKKHNAAIITNDLRLRKRLKKSNLKSFYLRQGKILGD